MLKGDAPHARLVDPEHEEREPGEDGEERVRREHGEEIALHLHVDLLQNAHRLLFARKRRPDEPDELGIRAMERLLRRAKALDPTRLADLPTRRPSPRAASRNAPPFSSFTTMDAGLPGSSHGEAGISNGR